MWRCVRVRGDKVGCIIALLGVFACGGILREQLNYVAPRKVFSRILDDEQTPFTFEDLDASKVLTKQYWARDLKAALKELRAPSVGCPKRRSVIILIHSKPGHARRRQVLREMWGSIHLAPVFVVGRSRDPHVQRSVLGESRQHSDLLVGDFIDSDRNSSLKSILSLKYFRGINCDSIDWIIKSEDYVFVNVSQILDVCKHFRADIVCQQWEWLPAQRDAHNKWYVSEKQYPFRLFPTTCSPEGYMLTSHAAVLLYEYSKVVPYLWFEPAWITGILAHRASLVRSDTPPHTFYQVPSLTKSI